MESNIFRYVWLHTSRQQLWIALIIVMSIPTYFLALTLPKEIVNGPISETSHEYVDGPARFLVLELPAIEWLDFGGATLFDGFLLDRLPHLIALCLALLALVVVNGGFKFYINIYKGRLSERVLRRLRFELVDRILRFPQPYTRRLRPAEISTMVNTEVEPMGGFVGEAYATPLFLLVQALSALAFILLQNVSLGLIAVMIVALQVGIIPRMRRRLVQLARMRQLAARQLAGRVAEIVEGSGEIRVNDASNWERNDISRRLGEIFGIRYRIFRAKFFIKFLNNFLSQLTPFLFYLAGGYAAIRGDLNVGQLVAVIAAYRDLPPPIKELIMWDQQRVDVQVKYAQVIEHFSPGDLTPPEIQAPVFGPVPRLEGPLAFETVALGDSRGAAALEILALDHPSGPCTAFVGDDQNAMDALGEALARLSPPLRGRIRVGDKDLFSLSDTVAGKRIAYVGSTIYYPNSSLADALLYGLRNRPAQHVPGAVALHDFDFEEARLSGNPAIDPGGDWIDLETAGASDLDTLGGRVLGVLKVTELYEDVFEMGLDAKIDPQADADLALKIVQARAILRFWVEEEIHADLIEPFDEDCYATEASVAANLVFGAASDDGALEEFLLERKTLALLDRLGVADRLRAAGLEIATMLAELIEAAGDDPALLRDVALITPDEVTLFKTLGAVAGWKNVRTAQPLLLRFALRYVETRDRLGVLDDEFRDALASARKALRQELGDVMAARFAFHEIDEFTPGATVMENILFGKPRSSTVGGRERIRGIILEMIAEMDMQDAIVRAGLSFEVGSGGKALTTAQRQKLGLARALLKRPDILVLNRAFSALGRQSEERILKAVLEEAHAAHEVTTTVLAILANPALALHFDRVVVVRERAIMEDGDPRALIEDSTSAFAAIAGRTGDGGANVEA